MLRVVDWGIFIKKSNISFFVFMKENNRFVDNDKNKFCESRNLTN
jgi:hypothetical protein